MPLIIVMLTPLLTNDPVGSVIAQATDPISGGAGWVGAGLLGAVLCWLLVVYLPAKDKQIKDFQDAKDKLIVEIMNARDNKAKEEMAEQSQRSKEQMAAKDALILQLISAKDKQMNDMLLHCEGELVKLTGTWRAEMEHLVHAIEDLSENVRPLRTP